MLTEKLAQDIALAAQAKLATVQTIQWRGLTISAPKYRNDIIKNGKIRKDILKFIDKGHPVNLTNLDKNTRAEFWKLLKKRNATKTAGHSQNVDYDMNNMIRNAQNNS